jgi:hypothetical protein
MLALRDRLREESFLAEVFRQQVEGYRLYGGFEDGKLVSLAGVRRSHTLSRGEHRFVDDLVTPGTSAGRATARKCSGGSATAPGRKAWAGSISTAAPRRMASTRNRGLRF